MIDMSESEFEELVSQAIDSIPDQVVDRLKNIALVVESDPPADGPVLLGLYEGVPITERSDMWGFGPLPDKITIFRNPILAICNTAEQAADEVAVTIVHEIAHHFGIGDARLHELGWG